MKTLAPLEAAQQDVSLQRELDRAGVNGQDHAGGPGAITRRPTLEYLRLRVDAVYRAAESGDQFFLRQSLVDLGAICAEFASTLERPDVSARRVT